MKGGDLDSQLRDWRSKYVALNQASLQWLLDRPTLPGGWLNTKVNSLTLADYGRDDGLRAPQYTYGWIQGRGLEALVTHAGYLQAEAPDLAARAMNGARSLYENLAALYAEYGNGYFLYDGDRIPIHMDSAGQAHRQLPGAGFATYSQAFMLKGLIAAAQGFDTPREAAWRGHMQTLIADLENGHFIQNERQPLDAAALSGERENYGPRMILLGAAALLRERGHEADAAFGHRFIDHVLNRHMNAKTHLLRDEPDGDLCNPGHAIEFFGFALGFVAADDPRIPQLLQGLLACCEAGFHGPGVAIAVSVKTGAVLEPHFPWWTLPETIRATALAYERSGDERFIEFWRRADTAFWQNYLRSDAPIAFQNRDWTGPVDRVPATSDLDPLYHTGLSLLGAIRVVDRLTR
ncbi:AGE family epimerase/isomerase [Devosia ginsengisoli]|uniref:AGE family epimerase/isomerase n=1 Tax=Devosia ginsengisoli TaxID=400770 RepID=UPI0026EF6DF7|nr:AGE family epimerase/isomerase [Devosia ginsengisoli]MCR6673567.1 AGE family epimerase/isomerase [Devosia ginsengisoli]